MKELEVRGDLCDNDLSCSFSPNFKHDHAMINITIENWIKGNIDNPGAVLAVKSQVGDLSAGRQRECRVLFMYLLPR